MLRSITPSPSETSASPTPLQNKPSVTNETTTGVGFTPLHPPHPPPSPSSSTASPSLELNKIFGKCNNNTRPQNQPPPSSKSVSWSNEWTYHPYTPWHPTNTHTPIRPPGSTTDASHRPNPPIPASTPYHQTQHPIIFPSPGTSIPSHQFIHTNPTQPLPNIGAEQIARTSPYTIPPVSTPLHDAVPWPDNLTAIIKQIISSPLPAPTHPEFTFELTPEAAHRNLCIINKYKGNLSSAIDAQRLSPCGYGSEFRPTTSLQPLLYLHPTWEKFKTLLTQGSDWPLDPISEEARQADVDEALQFGNHKEATNNPALLMSLITDDVTHGFALPLPLDKIKRIPGVLLAPLNIAIQDTIDEHGHIVPKRRLTHDQSYIFQGSGTSVNSRTDKSKLTPCIFGWVIRCLAHWIICAC